MGNLAEWLRRVAGILVGKANLLEALDDAAKGQLSWLKWRHTIVGAVAGYLVGFITRSL